MRLVLAMGESNDIRFDCFLDEVVSTLSLDETTRFFFALAMDSATLDTSDSTETMVEDVLSSRVTFGLLVTLASGLGARLIRIEAERFGRTALEDNGESSSAILQKGTLSSVLLGITVLLQQTTSVRKNIIEERFSWNTRHLQCVHAVMARGNEIFETQALQRSELRVVACGILTTAVLYGQSVS